MKIKLAFISLVILASRVGATVVGFTAEEGYVDGPLGGQTSAGFSWVETAAGSFVVDASNGTVVVDSEAAANFKAAEYSEILTGTTNTLTLDFSYVRGELQPAANRAVIRLSVDGQAGTEFRGIAAAFNQVKYAENTYFINLYNNLSYTSDSGSGVSGSVMGMSESDNVSDDLRLTLESVYSGTGDVWIATATLLNLTTSSELTRVSYDWTADAAWTSGDKNLRMDNSNLSDFTNTQVIISQAATSALETELEPEPDFSSETIEFLADEGYSDGPLVSNVNWNGHSEFTVDSTAGTVTMDAATAYKRIAHTQNLGVADRYEVGVRFSFSRIAEAVLSANMDVLSVEFGDAASTSAGRIAMSLVRAKWNTAKYNIGLYENTGSENTSKTSLVIDEAELGFGSADEQSDELWLSVNLTRGEDASSWLVSSVLSNLTAGTLVKTLEETAIDTSSAFFDGEVYGMLSSSKSEADSMVSNRVVDAFCLAIESDTSESYADWINDYALSGDDTLADGDPDGDGFSNIQEYAFGGDPTTAADSLTAPVCFWNDGMFELVHVALTNSPSGIEYIVETTTDLASGVWTNAGITTVSGPVASGGPFDSVTNRISADGLPAGFMRLTIVEQP
jgi:hypothetical protein